MDTPEKSPKTAKPHWETGRERAARVRRKATPSELFLLDGTWNLMTRFVELVDLLHRRKYDLDAFDVKMGMLHLQSLSAEVAMRAGNYVKDELPHLCAESARKQDPEGGEYA